MFIHGDGFPTRNHRSIGKFCSPRGELFATVLGERRRFRLLSVVLSVVVLVGAFNLDVVRLHRVAIPLAVVSIRLASVLFAALRLRLRLLRLRHLLGERRRIDVKLTLFPSFARSVVHLGEIFPKCLALRRDSAQCDGERHASSRWRAFDRFARV